MMSQLDIFFFVNSYTYHKLLIFMHAEFHACYMHRNMLFMQEIFYPEFHVCDMHGNLQDCVHDR